jgi:hypothetical protein
MIEEEILACVYKRFQYLFDFFEDVSFGISGSRVASAVFEIIHGEKLSKQVPDLDLYFLDQRSRSVVHSKLVAQTTGSYVTEDRFFVLDVQSAFSDYDLIFLPNCKTFREILTYFDLTLNGILLTNLRGGQKQCYYLESFIEDIKQKQIRINHISNSAKTLQRIVKYAKRGFSITEQESQNYQDAIAISNTISSARTVYNLDEMCSKFSLARVKSFDPTKPRSSSWTKLFRYAQI